MRVARGDAEAVRECLARYGGLVWSLARRHTASTAEAEDATQEIFLELWRSAQRYDVHVASEAAFITMIARRRLIDRRRRSARRLESTGELVEVRDEGPGPEICAEAALAAKALDQIRPEQRQVLLLATCQGLSHDEIAKETGMPLGTVKAHARRGLSKIRAVLLGVEDEVERSS